MAKKKQTEEIIPHSPPQSFMITGVSKSGLSTEYAYLELQNKALANTMMCHIFPKVLAEYKKGNLNVIDIEKADLARARRVLNQFRNVKSGFRVEDALRIVEENANLEPHKITTTNAYFDYVNEFRVFIEKAFWDGYGSDFEVVTL